jgi:hypothetical protein
VLRAGAAGAFAGRLAATGFLAAGFRAADFFVDLLPFVLFFMARTLQNSGPRGQSRRGSRGLRRPLRI